MSAIHWLKKRRRPALALLAIAASALFLTVQSVEGATPTPTPTATVVATSTPRPVVAEFSGTAWVDARLASGPVQARINGQVCGESGILAAPDAGPFYDLRVVSDNDKPGCGKPGDLIMFFISDRQANQTAAWNPTAGSYHHLTLIAGPPFAQFFGYVALGRMPVQERIVPFVNNVECGYQLNSWQGSGSPYGYQVVVLPKELKDGCGFEGAEVTFKLLDAQGSVVAIAPEHGIWHIWDGTGEIPHLDLAMSPARIGMPGSGQGRSGRASDSLFAALGLLGVALVGLGSFMRRRGRKRATGG